MHFFKVAVLILFSSGETVKLSYLNNIKIQKLHLFYLDNKFICNETIGKMGILPWTDMKFSGRIVTESGKIYSIPLAYIAYTEFVKNHRIQDTALSEKNGIWKSYRKINKMN